MARFVDHVGFEISMGKTRKDRANAMSGESTTTETPRKAEADRSDELTAALGGPALRALLIRRGIIRPRGSAPRTSEDGRPSRQAPTYTRYTCQLCGSLGEFVPRFLDGTGPRDLLCSNAPRCVAHFRPSRVTNFRGEPWPVLLLDRLGVQEANRVANFPGLA